MIRHPPGLLSHALCPCVCVFSDLQFASFSCDVEADAAGPATRGEESAGRGGGGGRAARADAVADRTIGDHGEARDTAAASARASAANTSSSCRCSIGVEGGGGWRWRISTLELDGSMRSDELLAE